MVYVLHAHWRPAGVPPPTQSGAIVFWAEVSPESGAKGSSSRNHPFCAGADTLQSLLGGELLGHEQARVETFTLRLPSSTRRPLPSPELEAMLGRQAKSPALRPWNITGLRRNTVEAVATLMEWLEEERTPADVRPGASVRYWQRAASLALEALAQQKLVPGLKRFDDALYARWFPLLDGHRVAELGEVMPPVCRAGTDLSANGTADGSLAPESLLRDFLEETFDALARAWASAPEPAQDPFEPGSRWVHSLFGRRAPIEASAAQLESLERSHRLWLRNLKLAGDEHFRVALRLSAPDPPPDPGPDHQEQDTWLLDFFLQARDDPSLLVGAADIWHGGEALAGLRRLKDPQEKLLTGLGYAARFFAPLEHTLQESSSPSGVELNAQDAFRFMRECAPLLEEAGFGVLVPPWWNRSSARLRLRPRVSPASSSSDGEGVAQGMMSLDRLMNYRWELSLGEKTLSKEEFETLAALKSPLVRLRGEWVRLDPEQVEKALEFFSSQGLSQDSKQNGESELSPAEALKLGLGGVEEVEGLEVEDATFENWLAEWFERLDGERKLGTLPAPSDLRAELRPYQQAGYSWLAFLRGSALGACLADDMGLGKCLAPDTLVPVNGTPQTVEEIWRSYTGEAKFDGEGFWVATTGKLLVNAIDESTGRIVQAPIRRLYRQWIGENLRTIHLEDGSRITITRRHRLLTSGGWTNELKVGDHVCVPAKTVWRGELEDHELVTFLAWQIAEGHEMQDRATVNISQKDVGRLEGLRGILHRIGTRYRLATNRPSIRTPKDRVSSLLVNSRAYRRFLEEKGYVWGRKSREKEIPAFVMQADLDTVRIFLRHYFEAEASVNSGMRTVEISTASRLLIQQLSPLLRRFGIWLRISEKRKRATNGSGVYRNYYIGTLGGESARKFLGAVGFDGPEKQRKLEQVCVPRCNTNVEGIPASNIVARMVEQTGLPLRHLGMYNTVYTNGTQEFSRSSLRPVMSAINGILNGEAEKRYRQRQPTKWTARTLEAYVNLDVPQLKSTRQQLRRLLDQEVFYCKIKEIEETSYDGWVYDFEVVGHHNFVAENILCHNTIQTLALFSRDQEQGLLESPVLVVCPTSVVSNWYKEAERFTPNLRVLIHQGPDRLQDEEFMEELEQTDLVVTSYALLRRDAGMLQSVEWHAVVLDEAQNIKNPAAQQSKLAYGLSTNFRMALTGTPVENRLAELWSIMRFLNPGYLGSQKEFRGRFARPIEREGDQKALGELHKLTRPLILRRLKSDPKIIDDLPDKQEMKVYAHLSEEQASLYEAVVRDVMEELEESEGVQRKGLVLSMLTRLKQVCNHPAQFLHEGTSNGAEGGAVSDARSGKLLRLLELLDEVLSVGDRCLIFTQYKEMGEMLHQLLPERFACGVQFIHGGTSAKKRTEMVRRFQEDEEGPQVFILSLKAGGTGLNLTRANHVFHFDRWWNPAVEDQATDRAFRIGQKRNVEVHKFVCVGTLEERIDEMIEQKKALAESVVGSDEAWITELSDQELREMVTLRKEALV